MNITPENYIAQLKNIKKLTRWSNRQIDIAIDEMQGRLKTGYTFKEEQSKMAVKNCRELIMTIFSTLNKLENCSIEY